MPTANVSLSQQQADFIRKVIKSGRYQNVSEVMRAGLEVLSEQDKERRARLAALRKLVQEGVNDLDEGRFETVLPGDLPAYVQSLSARRKKARGK